jgi:tetratricopeptide (TPR) repeat protein
MTASRRKVIWVVGVLLLAGAVVVFQRRSSATPLEHAQQALAAGQTIAAQKGFLNHLRVHPRDWAVRIQLAELLKSGLPDEALQQLRLVPPDAPEFLTAARHIAEICLTTEHDLLAEPSLLALLEVAPEDHGVRLSLAEMYHRTRRPKLALPHAVKASQLRSDRVETLLLLAEIHDDLSRPMDMIAPLQRALEIQPDLFAAHLNLCYALTWVGRWDEARVEARWALERDPRNAAAHRFLALCARGDGDHDIARGEIRESLRLNPDDVESRIVEAELLLFDRQAGEAYERLWPLREKRPSDRRILSLLARAASASGKHDEARTLTQEVSRLAEESRRREPSP